MWRVEMNKKIKQLKPERVTKNKGEREERLCQADLKNVSIQVVVSLSFCCVLSFQVGKKGPGRQRYGRKGKREIKRCRRKRGKHKVRGEGSVL